MFLTVNSITVAGNDESSRTKKATGGSLPVDVWSRFLRAAPVLLSAGLTVSALDLQGEKDPDSLVQKHGVDRFLELLGNATDIFDFALKEWAGDVSQLTGREKSERIEGFVPLLGAVTDPVVRNDAAQRIADAFRLEFETVWSRVRGRGAQRAPVERQPSMPGASAEKTILAMALQGKLSESVAGRLQEELFQEPACKTLFSIIKNDVQAGNPIDFAEIATQLRGEAELTLLSELSLTDEFDDAVLGRLEESLQPLERRYIDTRLLEIQRDIQDAAKRGDESSSEKLTLRRMLNTMK